METLQLVTPPQEFKDFMAMPDGLAKNISYYNNINSRQFSEASITRKDGHIYFAANTFKVVKSTKSSYYVKRVTKDGFTVDPKGKLSIWFNKNIFQMPYIQMVFTHFNFNWLSEKLYPFVTKGIFEKMIASKITNNIDVCKAYTKVMRINCSPTLFLRLFTGDSMISKQEFLRQASIAKDINHMIEFSIDYAKNYREAKYNDVMNEKSRIIADMIKEAQILEKKIDYTWSLNRLKEEHKDWTEKIMQVEIDSLDNVVIPNVERFDRYTPENFKLLKTQKEVFYEGKTMKHCVYTAYWTSIKNGNYIAYHITEGNEEATLGVNIYGNKLVYNQCYSRYNNSISDKLEIKVKAFIEELNEQVIRDGVFNNPVQEEYVQEYVQIENNIIHQIPF